MLQHVAASSRAGHLPRALLIVLVCLLPGCGSAPGPSGGGIPAGAVPMGMLSGRDPVGFLLQWRDSIGIDDSTADRLVRLNLRLFRRNQQVQVHLDSIMHGVRISERSRGRRDSTGIPDSILQRTAPLRSQIDAQTSAVKDTAWAMLSDLQRMRADSIETHLRGLMRRQGPQMGGGLGRP